MTPEADYAGDVTVAVAADAALDGNGVGNAAASEDVRGGREGSGADSECGD